MHSPGGPGLQSEISGLTPRHEPRPAADAVFQDAPVSLFLLERDGTVQRANRRAGRLLGFPPGYATGKSFTAFVELAARAAMRGELAAARRTGEPGDGYFGIADVGLVLRAGEPPKAPL